MTADDSAPRPAEAVVEAVPETAAPEDAAPETAAPEGRVGWLRHHAIDTTPLRLAPFRRQVMGQGTSFNRGDADRAGGAVRSSRCCCWRWPARLT